MRYLNKKDRTIIASNLLIRALNLRKYAPQSEYHDNYIANADQIDTILLKLGSKISKRKS